MAVIDNFRGIITVFIEFQTTEQNTEETYVTLKEFYESTVKGYEGLVSVNYHVALDGKSIHNYSQWKTEEAFDKFFSQAPVKKLFKNLGSHEPKVTKTKVVFAS